MFDNFDEGQLFDLVLNAFPFPVNATSRLANPTKMNFAERSLKKVSENHWMVHIFIPHTKFYDITEM